MNTPYLNQLILSFDKLIAVERLTKVDKVKICEDIQNTLNLIFPKFTCIAVYYTENNDNEFFGDRVYPSHSTSYHIVRNVIGDLEIDIPFTKYQLELDSKLFDGSCMIVTGAEIAALILNDINALSGVEAIENVADAFHNILVKNDMIYDKVAIDFCPELFTFVIMESLRYCTSVFCKNSYNDLTGNPIEYKVSDDPAEKELFELAVQKVKTMNPEFNGENPSACSYMCIMLEWYLHIYETVNRDRYPIVLLKRMVSLSGSKLFKERLEQIIDVISRRFWYERNEGAVVCESKVGIFSKMKIDGLKSIEDDLYEYKMRIRNVETQDDALLLMRQINNRMAILDQYLMENDDLPEKTEKHWRDVYEKYYKLREELSDKSVYNKKMYGLFVDYNALQQMSNSNITMNTYY